MFERADQIYRSGNSPANSDEDDLIRREEQENCVRSDIIFRAEEKIVNKYKLCQTASKATRRLHIASRNTQETINSAFVNIAAGLDLPALEVVIA